MSDLRSRAVEREIDGVIYKAWPLSWDVMRPLTMKVGKLVALVGAAASRGEFPNLIMANALDTIAANLDDATVKELSKAFGDASCYVDGDREVPLVSQNQGLHFAGRPLPFFQWLALGLEGNGFGPLVNGLKAYAALMMQPTIPDEPTTTVPTPTGA